MNPFPEAQRRAAVVVGTSYLLGMTSFIFLSILRLGTAAELAIIATGIARSFALYGILAPVDRRLASIATVVSLAADLFIASIGAQGLGDWRSHPAAYRAGLVFAGAGSMVFAWLWMKSSYIPRGLAFLGLIASALVALGNLELAMLPFLRPLFGPWFMAPMFFFEMWMGLWLLSQTSERRHAEPSHGDAMISTVAR